MTTQLLTPHQQNRRPPSLPLFLVRLLTGGLAGAGAGMLAGGMALESLAWALLAGIAGAAAGVFGAALSVEGEPADEWDR